jgi:hypothetical protein
LGVAQNGLEEIGVFSGAEAAEAGSQGLLSGIAGFTYGGFGWTDLSFKIASISTAAPKLKDNVYYATRADGGIALIHYRRVFVNEVLAPGILDAPTDLAFIAPSRSICNGKPEDGGNGRSSQCGAPDFVGADAGDLFVIESGTGRIAKVPLVITNNPAGVALCVPSTALGTSGSNLESGQGVFCDPRTGLLFDGGACPTGGTCRSTGPGLPNTRIVADPGGITYLTPQFVTDPVAVTMFTPHPVPHRGRITSGRDGLVQTAVCNPNPPGSCDDIQAVPVGQGVPDSRVVEAAFIGNTWNLTTAAQGDDFIIGDNNLQVPGGVPATSILSGPDGISQTTACNPNPPGSCTDIQWISVGNGEPFARVIEAGPNGVLDTTPSGDDRVLESPTLFVANADGTVVWMDLQGLDPITHTAPPRFFVTPLSNITGMSIGDFVDGEGIQILLTTTDFGGGVASFDPTLADNTEGLAGTLSVLTDLNDTFSVKLDSTGLCGIPTPGICNNGFTVCTVDADCPGQNVIPLPATTLPTGLSHVALDFYPGEDGYIGTPDDPHFNTPDVLSDASNISITKISEPNEITTDGGGGNIYGGDSRQALVTAGSFGVNTLNAPFDGILVGDPTVDLFNFISGDIHIRLRRLPSRPNAILAGPDGIVQTEACKMLDGTPIPGCDDFQLTLAGNPVFTGPRGMSILAGPNGVAESGIGGDDVQQIPVGIAFSTPALTGNFAPYQLWTTNVVGVSAGPNGVLETLPGNDDSTAGCAPLSICTGPNGVVNSGVAGDDVQLIAPGTAGLTAATPVVGPGRDEFIQTSPGGDDVLGGGQPLDVVIQPGPDGILQTPVAPGDVTARLTPLEVADLDIFAFSRPVITIELPTMPYAFLDPAGANSGVVDISNGKTSNSLDAAVDAAFPSSSGYFGSSYESPTGEIDFIVRNISLTAAIDNTTGLVFGRGVDRDARVPPVSLLYQVGNLSILDNSLVGSSLAGRQLVLTPGKSFEPDRTEKKSKKKAKKKKKKKKK